MIKTVADKAVKVLTPPPEDHPNKRFGFTLAETLVALAILGIVAVLTMPGIVKKYNEKVWEKQDWAVQHKLTLATDEMKALGLIGNYNSTESFVNVLQQYFKIIKICRNDNLEACWPSKTIVRGDGSEVNVSDLKTGKQFNPKDWTRNNLGLLTADGTSIIMSYKDTCPYLDPLTGYPWDTGMKTNATTSCIAMVYDLNGKGMPNESGKDVRLFNVSSLGKKELECLNFGGVCMMTSDLSFSPLTQAECEKYKGELGVKRCPYDEDYWAGALKACSDLGGRVPSSDDFEKIAKAMGFEKFGLIQGFAGYALEMLNDPLHLVEDGSTARYWSTEHTNPRDEEEKDFYIAMFTYSNATHGYYFVSPKNTAHITRRPSGGALLRCVK